MHDTAQSPLLTPDPVQHRFQRHPIRDIGCINADLRAGSLQLGEPLRRPRRVRAAAAGKSYRAGAPLISQRAASKPNPVSPPVTR